MNQHIIHIIQECFKTKPDIALAWVFGSVARGEERPESDVNLIVRLTDYKLNGAALIGVIGQIELELASLLKRPVAIFIDGRFHPSPAVQESIERDKTLIYERHNALEMAAEADKLVQELIAEGKLTPEIVEGWSKEHMRTPYNIDNDNEEDL